MNCRLPIAQRRLPYRSPRRGGFSFTEILFAVMILGIGFIMVAAMFPVAIRQTEAGSQETIAAAVGRTSSNYLAELAGAQLPLGVYNGGTSTTTPTVLPSILLPTIVVLNPGPPAAPAPPPQFILPPASMFTLPVGQAGMPGQATMVVPGQVWTMYDNRDPWAYSFSIGGALASPVSHNAYLWQQICRNMIVPDDTRFGWAAMYRRDAIVRGTPGMPGTSIAPANYAQVIVIGLQSRIKPAYNYNTDLNVVSPAITPFVPQRLGGITNQGGAVSGNGVQIVPAAYAGGTSYFNAGGRMQPPMLADDTYVVISDDNVPWGKPSHGLLNGRIFRLGAAPNGPGAWPLLPGSDVTTSDQVALAKMQLDLGGTLPVTAANIKAQFNVLVVGRQADPGGLYSGPAQDVTAYTTYLPIAN